MSPLLGKGDHPTGRRGRAGGSGAVRATHRPVA
jgi:hypothetical protein